jgi:hypothetical protein
VGVGSRVVGCRGVKVSVGGAVAGGVSVRGGSVASGVGVSDTGGGALTNAMIPRQ